MADQDDWQEVSVAAPPQPTPTQAPQQTDDWEDVGLAGYDELTGEDIPEAFSGASPQQAMNKSPVTAYDRFKLSMGNLDGNIKYLKKKFGDVRPVAEGSSDLAVLHEGKWHRVDPINGEIKDPWELAKEYGRDTLDMGPVGIGLGIAATPAVVSLAAAGTVASVVGAAAVTGVATAATRTSLGRIVGTYDSTPAQQTGDIAFETLLNAGGARVLAGVKPTASWVAKNLGKMAERFKDTVDDYAPEVVKQGARMVKRGGEAAANGGKKLFKKVFSKFSVGEDNFDTMVQHPNKVAAYMQRYDRRSGGKTSTYHDMIVQEQLERVRHFGNSARQTLSSIYGAMKQKVLQDVPETFVANADDVISTSYDDAIKAGIGKIMVGDKTLVGTEAAEYVAKNGWKGASFSLRTQKELAQAVKETGEMGDQLGFLAQDKEAYALVRDFFTRVSVFRGAKAMSGKDGARQLLDLKKNLSDISWSLANSEKAQSIPAIKALLDGSRAGMDRAIHGSLKAAGKGQSFTELNSTYSKLSGEFAPILSAHSRYLKTGDLSVFQPLASAFVARPGKQAAKKFAIDSAIDAAERYGHKMLAKRLANDKLMFQVSESARAFNPLPTAAGQAATGAGIGMGTYAVMTGNAPLAAAIGVSKAATSPTFSKAGVMLTQAMSKGQHWLSSLPDSQVSQFLSNPDAMVKFTTAILQAPGIRSEMDQQLSGQIEEAAQ